MVSRGDITLLHVYLNKSKYSDFNIIHSKAAHRETLTKKSKRFQYVL